MNNLQVSNRMVLKNILLPIIRWCVQHGVGYRQLGQILKPLFYQEALAELTNSTAKVTDTQISLVSGLHRADVVFFRRSKSISDAEDMLLNERAHPTSQVVARWVADRLPEVISIFGERESLEFLVGACCSGRSTVWSIPLILQDLVRQGSVAVEGQSVRLLAYKRPDDVARLDHGISERINACLSILQGLTPSCPDQSSVANGCASNSVDALSTTTMIGRQ